MEQVTICRVEMGNKGHKVWKVVRCDQDPGVVGEMTVCGLPRAGVLPLGTEQTVTLKIPE